MRCNATELNVGAQVAIRAARGGVSYDMGLLVIAVPVNLIRQCFGVIFLRLIGFSRGFLSIVMEYIHTYA